MRYGPLSTFDINRLTDILDAHKVSYEVEASKDDVDALDGARRDRALASPRSRPTFEQVMEYMYLEVPDSAVPLIASEIEKMGYGFVATGDELQDDPEFDALVARSNASSAGQTAAVRYIALAVIAAGLIAAYYYGWGPFAR